jgi:DNA invertase Pin-like site-specific DNA recombinase
MVDPMNGAIQRIAAYVRVSTREQAEGFGLDTQRSKIEQWAALRDVDRTDWYEDAGASGGTVERDGLQELLVGLQDGAYDALVVYKADRLSRSLRDLLTLIDDVLEPEGAAFVSVTEQFDTTTAQGRLFMQMIGSFAEFERNIITERLTEGRRSKALQGGHAAGEIPLGYEKGPDGKLRLTSRAETVRRIFEMRADDDMTLRAIAGQLNAEGVPTKRGGDWHASTVSYVLKNPKYRGVLRHVIGGEAVEEPRPDLAIS